MFQQLEKNKTVQHYVWEEGFDWKGRVMRVFFFTLVWGEWKNKGEWLLGVMKGLNFVLSLNRFSTL